MKAEKEEGLQDAAQCKILPSTTTFELQSSFRGTECGGRLITGVKGYIRCLFVSSLVIKANITHKVTIAVYEWDWQLNPATFKVITSGRVDNNGK